MKKILTILGLLLYLGTAPSIAQELPFIRSVELEFQKAIFDPARGLSLRANHAWQSGKKGVFQSALLVNGLLSPGSSPGVSGELEEFNGSFRVQLHTGWERYFGQKQRVYWLGEMFLGLRTSVVSGSLNQSSQNFNRDFTGITPQWDFGSRLGLGAHFGPHWGAQLTLTNSWRQINNPLGLPPGLFFWGPDILALVGFGVNYRL